MEQLNNTVNMSISNGENNGHNCAVNGRYRYMSLSNGLGAKLTPNSPFAPTDICEKKLEIQLLKKTICLICLNS